MKNDWLRRGQSRRRRRSFRFRQKIVIVIIQRNFFFLVENSGVRGLCYFRFYHFRFLVFKGCSLLDRFMSKFEFSLTRKAKYCWAFCFQFNMKLILRKHGFSVVLLNWPKNSNFFTPSDIDIIWTLAYQI